MTEAVIVSTARTRLAKSRKGAFNMSYGAPLGGHAVEHAVSRAGKWRGAKFVVVTMCIGGGQGAAGLFEVA